MAPTTRRRNAAAVDQFHFRADLPLRLVSRWQTTGSGPGHHIERCRTDQQFSLRFLTKGFTSTAQPGNLGCAESLSPTVRPQISSRPPSQCRRRNLVLAVSQLRSGQADQALRSLEPAKPYEFGTYADLLPNYLRAMAYLQLRRAGEAATEFRAVLDHRGVAPMATMWEMSQLGLARDCALRGDTAKARAAYQDFLALWKDADPDIPILKQAKAEYAKLM